MGLAQTGTGKTAAFVLPTCTFDVWPPQKTARVNPGAYT